MGPETLAGKVAAEAAEDRLNRMLAPQFGAIFSILNFSAMRRATMKIWRFLTATSSRSQNLVAFFHRKCGLHSFDLARV